MCGNFREITATGCVHAELLSLFLGFRFSMSKHLSCKRRRAPKPTGTLLAPPRMFPSSIFPSTHAMLFLSLNPFKEPAHGMGYPSARRDRPELRNQLVRQRRAVVPRASSCSSRFWKRVPRILSFPAPLNHRHHPLCLHAR